MAPNKTIPIVNLNALYSVCDPSRDNAAVSQTRSFLPARASDPSSFPIFHPGLRTRYSTK